LRSEASARFEKGVSAELSADAADRVCSLVADTGSGKVIAGSVDNYPGKSEKASVDVRARRINSLLGTDITADVMADMFRRLEMKVETLPDDVLRVTPPHIRLDLNEEVDFSEEVARLYGYDELGLARHKDSAEAGVTESWALRSLLRGALSGMGYQEIQTYSFVSPKGLDKAGVPEKSDKRSFVKLINPLGEENSVMRTILLPNMLDILAHNYNHGNETARLFEIGNTFSAVPGEAQADERLSLVIGSYGGGDFFSLKGALNAIFAKFGTRGAVWTPDTDSGSWHPGRCARVSGADGGPLFGHVGELHPDVLKNYDIDVPVFAAEIDFEALAKAADLNREYTPLRRFPAISFDISLLADEDVTVADVEAACIRRGGGILESVKLFDVYRGEQIAEGKKSLSFKLVYRAEDKTLTDEDAAKVHKAILSEISKATGAALREV
jgi:phenylalanyl-tRNA synthetase beta chain